jgi:hypothetical protein
MKKNVIATAVLLVAGVALVMAAVAMADAGRGRRGDGDCGKGHGPWQSFDAGKTEMITGTVVAMEPIANRRGKGQGMELKLNTGSGQVVVHVGPQWYLDQQSVKIASGDSVEITGAMVSRRGTDIFMASEVKKGNEVLKLRDEHGAPAWRGQRCNDDSKSPV